MVIQWSSGLNTANLGERFWNTIRENWYLGFTSFGGPPVHFKIVSGPIAPERSSPVLNSQIPYRIGWTG
jgi:hypothetical protein